MPSQAPETPQLARATGERRTPPLRRFAGAAIILLVAGVIWLVTSRQQEAQAEEIREFVTTLRQAVAEGREPGMKLPGVGAPVVGAPGAGAMTVGHFSQPILRQRCIEELRDVLREAESSDRVAIEVAAGDDAEFGDGRATHVARFAVDGRVRLGLRFLHRGGAGDFEVIGVWAPPASAAAGP